MSRTTGDPDGFRLARRRGALFAEARLFAAALDVLLRRAGVDSAAVQELRDDLLKRERAELMRAEGRIESRKRFKHSSGQVAGDGRPVGLLFIDESGRSNPTPSDSFFALGGISMSPDAADRYRRVANEVKKNFFGHVDITFHEPDMRNHNGPYYFGGDIGKQGAFCNALDELVEQADFVAFGVGVRKAAFQEFTDAGLDPYLPVDIYSLAIQMLLERYTDYLGTSAARPIGRVTFESQGPREDAEHQRDFVNVLLDGTQWISERTFRQFLEAGVRFTPKQGTDPMELADMLSRDLHEWVRGNCNEVIPRRWKLFTAKTYARGDKQLGKFGIKVFPDSDIREHIDAHRALREDGN